MDLDQSPWGSQGKTIVNPDILLDPQNRKYKAKLSGFQAAIMAKTNALTKYYQNGNVNVLDALVKEIGEFSGSVGGANVESYCEVAKARIGVEDRKRMFQRDENTM